MKKRFTLLLVVVLSFSSIFLSACHEKYDLEELAKEEAQAAEEEAGEEVVEAEAVEEESSTTESGEKAEEQEAPNDAAEPSTSTDTEETSEGAPPSSILGNTTKTSYSNSYFGVKFNVPSENWYIATEQELGEIMGMNASTINDDEIINLLNSSGYVMDFYALDTTDAETKINFDSINVTIEDIGKMYGVLATEKDLADASLETYKQALSAQGWQNVEAEVSETVFAGVPRVCTSSSAEMDDTKMFQKQIFLKKESYIACITVGTFGEDKTDDLLAAFTAL